MQGDLHPHPPSAASTTAHAEKAGTTAHPHQSLLVLYKRIAFLLHSSATWMEKLWKRRGWVVSPVEKGACCQTAALVLQRQMAAQPAISHLWTVLECHSAPHALSLGPIQCLWMLYTLYLVLFLHVDKPLLNSLTRSYLQMFTDQERQRLRFIPKHSRSC